MVAGRDTEYVIELPDAPSLAVRGTDGRFPVRRVYCVGRNYADHAREMGHDPQREEPFFFQKNADSVVAEDGCFIYPPATQEVHHEIEMVVAIGRGGENIPVEHALRHVYGYAVGLDMTRRDLQADLKKQGRPWEVAKAFDGAAPCSEIMPVSVADHPDKGKIWLDVNGVRRQNGDLGQMIWKVPEILSHLSYLFALKPGDLIFSGTPAGVGPVMRGDELSGGVEGVGELRLRVV